MANVHQSARTQGQTPSCIWHLYHLICRLVESLFNYIGNEIMTGKKNLGKFLVSESKMTLEKCLSWATFNSLKVLLVLLKWQLLHFLLWNFTLLVKVFTSRAVRTDLRCYAGERMLPHTITVVLSLSHYEHKVCLLVAFLFKFNSCCTSRFKFL